MKDLLDRARAENPLCRQMLAKDKAPLAASPGLAYMQEQRLRIKAKQELEDWLTDECSALESSDAIGFRALPAPGAFTRGHRGRSRNGAQLGFSRAAGCHRRFPKTS